MCELTVKLIPNGAITSFEYSVSATNKVYFSQGNLQYQASTGAWRFALNQYDYVGDNNENISSTYTGWIDLFGWGTSGWNSGVNAYQPYSTSGFDPDYYPGNSSTANLTSTYAKADWGVYNAISNGGNQKGMWRTLTKEEWGYMIFNRPTELHGLGTVNGKAGLIILPDDWVQPSDISYTPTISSYTTNVYTTAQWAKMESSGAIFLPSAGDRSGSSTIHVGVSGNYWSASYNDHDRAYGLSFNLSGINSMERNDRSSGLSVRLVQDVK